jgi:hypothetical protein
MIFGEERFFHTNVLNTHNNEYCEFNLSFLGKDITGMKFSGYFPKLWNFVETEVIGPQLYDDDYLYSVTNFDYDHKLIWLQQV